MFDYAFSLRSFLKNADIFRHDCSLEVYLLGMSQFKHARRSGSSFFCESILTWTEDASKLGLKSKFQTWSFL